MSDNYRVISKAKEAALNLKALGWSHNGIASEMGITHALLNDIQENDVVSVKVHTGTIEKLRSFTERYEAGLEMPERKKPVVHKKDPKERPEFETRVPESMVDAIPDDIGIITGPMDIDGNLLNELNLLARRFAGQGYRLNANIELVYNPE